MSDSTSKIQVGFPKFFSNLSYLHNHASQIMDMGYTQNLESFLNDVEKLIENFYIPEGDFLSSMESLFSAMSEEQAQKFVINDFNADEYRELFNSPEIKSLDPNIRLYAEEFFDQVVYQILDCES